MGRSLRAAGCDETRKSFVIGGESVLSGSRRGKIRLARLMNDVVEVGDPSAYPQLDEGESSVLSAAAAAGCAVIIDERKSRQLLATDANLRTSIPASIGIVGLLVLAKQNGRVSLVRPVLDELSSQGFRMNPGLYQAALEAAGEAE